MDMDMVPVYGDAHDSRDGGGRAASGTAAEGSASAAGGRTPGAADDAETTTVRVRPEIVQSLGVRTYTVTRGGQPRRIAVTGYLFHDARGLAVLVDLIDRDASLVRIGQRAEVRVADVPDRTWSGTVERIETDVDIGARTVKARVRLSQTGAALQPSMFAEVTILAAAASKAALFIPREALIRTGTRNAVVLALGEGRFQPVAVTPGSESDDWIEIRAGVKEGDVVVTSGQFLIDSEASVRASFARMQSEESAAPGEPKTPASVHTGH
jgi:membrane fusion protein, copper/silver efflux system